LAFVKKKLFCAYFEQKMGIYKKATLHYLFKNRDLYMGQVNTRNLSSGLYTEAKKLAKDGTISAQDHAQLTQTAKKDGINADEQKFLNGLKAQNNVNTLKEATSEPQTISFSAPATPSARSWESKATPRAIRNYERMSAPLQEKFNSVQKNSSAQTDLLSLLDKGTLTKRDSSGKTILENVQRMQSGPNKPGVNGVRLADDTLKAVNDRSNISQGPHGTCGAASLENVMMGKDPAEVTRLVKGLAADGQVTTRGGHVMKAGTGSLNWHEGSITTNNKTESRSDLDIIFQSAAMRSIALVGGDMDALGGLADYNVNKDNSDAASVATGDSASDPLHLTRLAENITGKDYDQDHLWGTYSEMVTNANAGKEPIALFTPEGGGMHYVTVTGVSNGKVHFYDTAQSSQSSRLAGSMSESEFKSRIKGTVTVD
jgi:hypothetical protein